MILGNQIIWANRFRAASFAGKSPLWCIIDGVGKGSTSRKVFNNAGASLDRKMIATGPKIRLHLHGRCGQRVPAGVGVAHGRRRATERAGAHREFHPARPPYRTDQATDRPSGIGSLGSALHQFEVSTARLWFGVSRAQWELRAVPVEVTATRRPGPLELADCHRPASCMCLLCCCFFAAHVVSGNFGTMATSAERQRRRSTAAAALVHLQRNFCHRHRSPALVQERLQLGAVRHGHRWTCTRRTPQAQGPNTNSALSFLASQGKG
jgi:hypothetical protein